MAQAMVAADGAEAAREAATRERWGEAIRLGTAANRLRRDPGLEAALVRWRCAAFVRGGRAAARAAPAPDPCPEVAGVPECSASELSAARVSGAIEHHGSLLVRGLIDSETAADLREGIDLAYAGMDSYRRTGVADPDGWFEPLRFHNDEDRRGFVADTASVLTADSPRMLFALIEIFEARGLLDLAEAMLGERPALSVFKSTLRRVAPGRSGGWHQDGAFLGDVGALNIWLALSDCGEDAPGLDIVDRRLPYVVQTGTHGAPLDWAVGDGMIGLLTGGGARVVRPRFRPGDAMLFDHLMLHRTANPDGASRVRYAIETWLFSPSRFPMEQLPLVI